MLLSTQEYFKGTGTFSAKTFDKFDTLKETLKAKTNKKEYWDPLNVKLNGLTF